MSVVLVTGGSGFIASYCILQLLAAGHQVGTTVRSLKRESDVRAMLKQGGAEPGDRLKFFAAELEQDAGWREAVTGCDYVLHVASPLSQHVPKNEDEMIVPARDGTLRVLRAARDAGVKRVVLTSSSAAISYGRGPPPARYDETHWTDVGRGDVHPYAKSKTLAERAAWDFIAREGGALELSVINPVLVLGPVFGPDCSPSIFLVKRLMEGAVPGCPPTLFRRCRCARHRRFAYPRHGRPCRQGRTLPGGRGRFHVGPSNCASAEGALGGGGVAGADA
jgi:nucleoside-diphosphate-sugar epimerase